MASTSLLGQTGPYAQGTSGVGTMGAAMSGATYQIGWPDREPAGPFGPWTDAVTPRFIVASILAALHRRSRHRPVGMLYRRRAGRGGNPVHDALPTTNTPRTARFRNAAASPARHCTVPQGLFRCCGEDRWIAIDASAIKLGWHLLRGLIGDGLRDAKFDTIVGRLRNRAELETAIANWTREQEAEAIEHRLQAAGVPAHVVSRSGDLARDVDLREAGHLNQIDDPVFGEAEIEGPRFSLDRTTASADSAWTANRRAHEGSAGDRPGNVGTGNRAIE